MWWVQCYHVCFTIFLVCDCQALITVWVDCIECWHSVYTLMCIYTNVYTLMYIYIHYGSRLLFANAWPRAECCSVCLFPECFLAATSIFMLGNQCLKTMLWDSNLQQPKPMYHNILWAVCSSICTYCIVSYSFASHVYCLLCTRCQFCSVALPWAESSTPLCAKGWHT